jgi:hypothetical protein
MKPQSLHKTRPEYTAFSLKTFRQHIHQEKRHQRELPLRVARRNKKAQYKHDKEVKENTDDEEFELYVGDEDDDDDDEEESNEEDSDIND